jgi:hypothetical protein
MVYYLSLKPQYLPITLAEIFHIEEYTVLVRNYKDFLVFLVASEDESELIMNELLTCLHECYLKIIS